MHARLSPRNRTGNSYDAMSAIIRAAQAAGYSKLKNMNKELSAFAVHQTVVLLQTVTRVTLTHAQ